MKYRITRIIFLCFWLFVGLVASLSVTAQVEQDIQEELYRKDSLINRVSKHNIDTLYHWQWNKDSADWELTGRDLKFFSHDRKLLANIQQDWMPTKGKWVNYQRTVKNYQNGKVVE